MINGWYSDNGSNWLIGHWNNSTENYYANGWVSSVQAGTSDTNWRIYTGTGRGPYSIYVNNSQTYSNYSGSQGPNGFAIGSINGGTSEFSNGQIGFLLAYNRILTEEEMTHNYNGFKNRYGL
jgi:hypothetical protein